MILVAILSITACKTSHTHTSGGELNVIEEPTCITEGKAEILCSECGEVATTVPVPKIAHTEVWIWQVEPTCTETGLTSGTYCSFCEATLVPQRVVPCKPHTEVTIPAVEHTCTETGLTEGKYCSVCYNITVKPEVVDKHHFVNFVCADCGEKHISTGLKFYTNGNGSVAVIGIGSCTDTNIGIPSTAHGGYITSISEGAFDECDSITSIYIPGTVVSLGMNVFNGLKSLTSVTFGDEKGIIVNVLDHINYRNFYNCSSLVNINIPDTVKTIYTAAFAHCTSLTNIALPNSIKKICNQAFECCTSLTSITLPNSIVEIDVSTFKGCTSLTSITIPNSVTRIGDDAFYKCSSLTSIQFNGTIEQWDNISKEEDWNYNTGNYTIYCTDGEITKDGTVTYYEVASKGLEFALNADGESYSVTGIGTCTDVRLIIPSTYNNLPVTSIGAYAFKNGFDLYSATIPASVQNINECAFEDCLNLEIVTFLEESRLEAIGDGAFAHCISLHNITIPAGVTTFGDEIFYDCESLKYNEYNNGLFLGNEDNPYLVLMKVTDKSLTSYSIPEKTVAIQSKVFDECSSLTRVEIPASVTTIAWGAFYRCTVLESVIFAEGSRLKNIGGFFCCTSLKSIEIPSSVETIGTDAFYGCSSLTQIEIPASVTTIGGAAFYCCTALESVTFAEGSRCTSIQNHVFTYCKLIESIIIPSGVIHIGQTIFGGCTALGNIAFEGTVAEWEAIEFGYSWNYQVPATEVVCSDGTVPLK